MLFPLIGKNVIPEELPAKNGATWCPELVDHPLGACGFRVVALVMQKTWKLLDFTLHFTDFHRCFLLMYMIHVHGDYFCLSIVWSQSVGSSNVGKFMVLSTSFETCLK